MHLPVVGGASVNAQIGERLFMSVNTVKKHLSHGGEAGRAPDEFRPTQNWIRGSSPDNARFVPPTVDEMKDALST